MCHKGAEKPPIPPDGTQPQEGTNAIATDVEQVAVSASMPATEPKAEAEQPSATAGSSKVGKYLRSRSCIGVP